MRILTGVDQLLLDPGPLRDARIGLVTNDAATTLAPAAGPGGAIRALTPTRRALQMAGVKLVRLFSPEHGLAGALADGAIVDDATRPVDRPASGQVSWRRPWPLPRRR